MARHVDRHKNVVETPLRCALKGPVPRAASFAPVALEELFKAGHRRASSLHHRSGGNSRNRLTQPNCPFGDDIVSQRLFLIRSIPCWVEHN